MQLYNLAGPRAVLNKILALSFNDLLYTSQTLSKDSIDMPAN